MGTWGHGPFDNDTACDWAHELGENGGFSKIEATIDAVLENGMEYLDANAADEGIVAADVIARLCGEYGVRNPYTEGVDEWVSKQTRRPNSALIEKAITALDRIVTKPSELVELWEESDSEAGKWKEEIAALRIRLIRAGDQAGGAKE